MYSCSSLIGLVSSKRKWQRPPNSWAIPELSAIALGWPRWRYPFGSGGKRVTTSEALPSRTSAATISRMKSRRSVEVGVRELTRLSLVISIRVMQYVACLAQSVHSRSGDNLTAHPEAAGIIRQASGFPRFDEFLGPRFALPAVQLDHPPRHLAGEDKAPAPRGRDGTSAQALLASTGNIWPTRNTQREANYAQLVASVQAPKTGRQIWRAGLPGWAG